MAKTFRLGDRVRILSPKSYKHTVEGVVMTSFDAALCNTGQIVSVVRPKPRSHQRIHYSIRVDAPNFGTLDSSRLLLESL